jgi:hypothetical protein
VKELLEKAMQALGVTLGVGVGLPLAFLIGKGVLKNLVDRFNHRSLERLKAELAADLEQRRQQFTRDLESERSLASRALEQFKAELLLQAEVRRQVAAQKVAALREIFSLGEPLMRTLFNVVAHAPSQRAQAHVQLTTYFSKVRELGFLFSPDVAKELSDYASTVHREASAWVDDNRPDALTQANHAYEAMIATIRRELGVSS